MTLDRSTKDSVSSFDKIVSLLEKNLKYIDSLGINEETVQDYRKVILYLKGISTEEISHILSKQSSKKKPSKESEPQITDEELTNMTSEEVKAKLQSLKLPRLALERLASVRFGVTKGALSSLRSREALRDKLFTLIENEEAHNAISRAVKGQEIDGKEDSPSRYSAQD
jgi:hypothetical protein